MNGITNKGVNITLPCTSYVIGVQELWVQHSLEANFIISLKHFKTPPCKLGLKGKLAFIVKNSDKNIKEDDKYVGNSPRVHVTQSVT